MWVPITTLYYKPHSHPLLPQRQINVSVDGKEKSFTTATAGGKLSFPAVAPTGVGSGRTSVELTFSQKSWRRWLTPRVVRSTIGMIGSVRAECTFRRRSPAIFPRLDGRPVALIRK